MPEKRETSHQEGEPGRKTSQNQRHLADQSAEELLDELETRLDAMTDLDYDKDTIQACLNALDQKAPLQKEFDTARSWETFRSKHAILFEEDLFAGPEKREVRPKRVTFRRMIPKWIAAVLAISVLCAACAQAAGLGVLGAIGRWTESVFSFGLLPGEEMPGETQRTAGEKAASRTGGIPEEYRELQAELEARGLPLYYLQVPEGFEAQEPFLYVDPNNDCIDFGVSYVKDEDYITFGLGKGFTEYPITVYEKNRDQVEIMEYSEVIFYLFSNSESQSAVWKCEEIEYYLTIPLESMDLKEFITSSLAKG